jgi:hypothetical protein
MTLPHWIASILGGSAAAGLIYVLFVARRHPDTKAGSEQEEARRRYGDDFGI